MAVEHVFDPISLDDLLAARTLNTTPARAVEIANMRNFGLREFIEITGVGAGEYGIYLISETNGVEIKMTPLADIDAVGQKNLLQAREKLSLKFPCTPTEFSKWHDATRGEISLESNGEATPSDFPLHKSFIDQINTNLGHPPSKIKDAVTSLVIKDAFNGIPKDADSKWWGVRLRDPDNYGLSDARVAKGKAGRNNPSLWDPIAVGSWIIEKYPELKNKVIQACKKHFPDHDTDFLA